MKNVEFEYFVGDKVFSDTVAFGDVWKNEVKPLAEKTNTAIFRKVTREDGSTLEQFYATSGCFLGMKFYSEDKVNTF